MAKFNTDNTNHAGRGRRITTRRLCEGIRTSQTGRQLEGRHTIPFLCEALLVLANHQLRVSPPTHGLSGCFQSRCRPGPIEIGSNRAESSNSSNARGRLYAGRGKFLFFLLQPISLQRVIESGNSAASRKSARLASSSLHTGSPLSHQTSVRVESPLPSGRCTTFRPLSVHDSNSLLGSRSEGLVLAVYQSERQFLLVCG
jgi:hypothetical protein